ncbi:glucokinase-like ROK family protein [Anaerobacterium chartisolvens]|uniref:Glucokinase-like ROK family protein n=1 Tax=Anaerobacterium chartisolvens TaxID=1297424 RepID=A0A369BFC5_9FIRM|nr:ROK family transcriptional regulator [Anaerobacterium chartisolvens]RCX19975.1 glucokinase-like ROK family protein [Anaerobacterium chartisolvens]
MKRAGNNQFLKQFNQTAILDLIRIHGPVSRAELSKITGLSPTATGIIVSGILEQGYIFETGTGKSKGGRRPVMLQLRPDSFYSVGVDIDIDYVNIMVVDITGNVVYEKAEFMAYTCMCQLTVSRIEYYIKVALDFLHIDSSKILGIGISIPGMVDSRTHEIILAPNLKWENIFIKDYIKRFSNIPVYVENEAMASAICENWIGACQGIDNFVCINVKSGIGAGIFTGGRLYRGTGGSAGEVGHISVHENGPKCGCGNYGCLETLSSTVSMVETARKLVRQGVVSRMNSFEDVNEIGLDQIVECARAGDEAARGILSESSRYLAIAISSIVNTLNPSKIVIGKEFVKYADLVMEHIKSIVSAKALRLPAMNVEIIASEIGQKSSTMGAAIVPLKVLFGK